MPRTASLLDHIIELDRQTTTRLALHPEARFLRLFALITAHSGDSPLWLLGAVIALTRGTISGQIIGLRILLATLAAGGVTTALKWAFRRQRPPGEGAGFYSRFDRPAFPSGHAGRTACLVILIAPLLPGWSAIPLVCWVGFVGLARVTLQVHFICDILGGWVVGLLTGFILLTAL